MKNYQIILKVMAIIIILLIPKTLFSQNQYLAHVLQPDPISTPAICIVTLGANDKNTIIWDNLNNNFINYYKIFREATQQTGKWDSIGFISYTKQSIFVDSTSEPLKQSYRYKISAIDECGNETPMSGSHKTMNLSILKSVNNTYSLIWSEYEGFLVSSYRIYRGTTKDDLKLIGSTTAGNFSYNDSYSQDGSIFYQVEVLSPNVCSIDKLKSTSTYNSSRSNIVSNLTTVENDIYMSLDVKIFPNPFNLKTTISFPNRNNQAYVFSVYDVSGKKVVSKNVDTDQFYFYKENLSEGLYFVEIKGTTFLFKNKLLITK